MLCMEGCAFPCWHWGDFHGPSNEMAQTLRKNSWGNIENFPTLIPKSLCWKKQVFYLGS